MSVGLLLMTHNALGAALAETATHMLARSPLRIRTLEVALDSDLAQVGARAAQVLRELDEGAGVLILADMFGSTPANLARGFIRSGQVAMVTGVNLSMVVRVLNYPHLGLNELADKEVTGGRDGVLLCEVDG